MHGELICGGQLPTYELPGHGFGIKVKMKQNEVLSHVECVIFNDKMNLIDKLE